MAKPIPGLGFSVPRREHQDGVGFFAALLVISPDALPVRFEFSNLPLGSWF